ASLAFRHSVDGHRRKETGPLDYVGAALVTLGLAGIVGALITGPDAGFSSPLVLVTGSLGIVLTVAFFIVESRSDNPLLPLDVFKSRPFLGAHLNTPLLYAAPTRAFF